MATTPSTLVFALALSLGCVPDPDDRPSVIDSTRILAIIAEPPEAEPGDEVTFRVVVASPDGPVEDPSAYWSFCTTKKSIAENNAVDAACWDEKYSPFGGPSVEVVAAIPEDACSRYGPEASDDSERPNDPDASGGFYQPVRVSIPELAAFGFERLTCRLPNAPPDVVEAFEAAHRPNANPSIRELRIEDASGEPVERASGTVSIRVEIDSASRESFLRYDQQTVSLIELEETLRASFFTNAGSLELDVLDVEGDTIDLGWTLPDTAGEATLWVVLRDSRGGAAAAHASLTID